MENGYNRWETGAGAGGITATRDMMVAGLGIGIRTMYLRNVEWIMVSRFHALTVPYDDGMDCRRIKFSGSWFGAGCLPASVRIDPIAH